MSGMQPKQKGCRVCGQPIYSRGLCQKHYRRFKARMDRYEDPSEAKAFELRCIADGWVMPLRQGQRPLSDPDPFGAIADEVDAMTTEELAEIQEQDAAASAAYARDAIEKKKTKKKTAKRSTKRKTG